MKDRFDDPSNHERTLLPRSYISLLRKEIQRTYRNKYQKVVLAFAEEKILMMVEEKKMAAVA